MSSRRESQSVLSQPRVISNAFSQFPVASKACPTCGMQHAQSDLQSTCLANQPLQQLSVCSRLQTPPRCRGCDLLFSCALMYFCRQMSVVFFLLLNSAWYDLLRSQLVCIPPSQLSAPLSENTSSTGRSRVKSRPYHCSLPDPGAASVCPLTCLSVCLLSRQVAWLKRHARRCCVCLEGYSSDRQQQDFKPSWPETKQRTHREATIGYRDQKQVYNSQSSTLSPRS